VTATSTYLRYEVEIGYTEPNPENGSERRLSLLSESLHDYTLQEAIERLRFPYTEEFFEAVILHEGNQKNSFIETKNGRHEQGEVIWYANGTNEGQAQIVEAAKTARTIVAGASGVPVILAAQREMQGWLLLAMEPRAIRAPSPIGADPHITENGGHLHATLHRIATTAPSRERRSEEVYAEIRTRLSRLFIVWTIEVRRDPLRQLLMTYVAQRFKGKVPAHFLSDGILRFLTLATLSEDPDFRGLLCIEEPENGIHPAKMKGLIKLLKQDMIVDTTCEPDDEEDNFMRQLIIATHSPYLVQLLEPDDLLIARQVTVKAPSGKPTTTLQCLPLSETWRECKNEPRVDWITMMDYLVAPPDARVTLPASLKSQSKAILYMRR
jgi:predicted ATPase